MSWAFSCDLAAASRQHRDLLRAVHTCGKELYKAGPDLVAAIESYRKEFMPSLHHSLKTQQVLPAPPLAVAWVWHLHKLEPVAYAADCKHAFGEVLQAPGKSSPFQFSPQCPKHLPGENNHCTEFRVSCDIAASARRQSVFLWHVRGQQYDDEAFLEAAVMRYAMMLGLMRRHPGAFIVPTYDQDLMWHTHLAFPSFYEADCQTVVGRLVRHDDSVNDRSEHSKLSISTATTRELFYKAYGYTWEKEGAMYNGEPPAWYWTDRALAASAAEASPSPSGARPATRCQQHLLNAAAEGEIRIECEIVSGEASGAPTAQNSSAVSACSMLGRDHPQQSPPPAVRSTSTSEEDTKMIAGVCIALLMIGMFATGLVLQNTAEKSNGMKWLAGALLFVSMGGPCWVLLVLGSMLRPFLCASSPDDADGAGGGGGGGGGGGCGGGCGGGGCGGG